MNVLMCLLGLGLIAAANCTSIELAICPDDYCYSTVGDCQRAIQLDHGDLVKYNAPAGDVNQDCYCFCGKAGGVNCTRETECIEGYECVISKDHARKTVGVVNYGLCHSKCDGTTSTSANCTPFEKCVLVGGDALCMLRFYKCKSGVSGMAVEGVRAVNGQMEKQTFESPCFMIEYNREMQSLNPTANLFIDASGQ